MNCKTKGCRNEAAKNRRMCLTCVSRLHRKNNLIRYSYDTLKANAIRRGHVFTLTFTYFKKFCYETKYHLGKGRSKVAFSIDKIKNELGYVEGNIQILTVGENSRKGTKSLYYDWETGYATYK